ncbi:hypothetical protein Trydic_g1343 [Trypoxylus dichotomus]
MNSPTPVYEKDYGNYVLAYARHSTKTKKKVDEGIQVLYDKQNFTPKIKRFQGYNCEVINHPSHGLDLFPSDKRFEDDHELQDEVRQYLKNLDLTFYEEGIQKLVPRWDKYLNIGDGYVER